MRTGRTFGVLKPAFLFLFLVRNISTGGAKEKRGIDYTNVKPKGKGRKITKQKSSSESPSLERQRKFQTKIVIIQCLLFRLVVVWYSPKKSYVMNMLVVGRKQGV